MSSKAVHCSLYYRDMLTPDCGATEIVSASHLDEAYPMPGDEDTDGVTAFAPRAQDVIVWVRPRHDIAGIFQAGTSDIVASRISERGIGGGGSSRRPWTRMTGG